MYMEQQKSEVMSKANSGGRRVKEIPKDNGGSEK